MSLHITGDDITFAALIVYTLYLSGKMMLVNVSFVKLYQQKYGRQPITWKDYWNA